MKKQITTVTIATLLVASVLLVSTASALVTSTESKSKTVAETDLYFTSSFVVTGTTSETITIEIRNDGPKSITVTDVDVNKCTPKPNDCSAAVSMISALPITITPGGTGSVDVTVSSNAKNVHLWVMLTIDGGSYHIGANVHFR